MRIQEACPFSVNLWAEDELSIERVLATAATVSMARAAFDVASLSYPDRTVSLMGPGCLESRPAISPITKAERAKGLTADPARLAQHRVALA
jgi:hypothetical protein